MKNKELFGITDESMTQDLIRTYNLLNEIKYMFLNFKQNEAEATVKFTLELNDKKQVSIKEFTNIQIERETEVLKQKSK